MAEETKNTEEIKWAEDDDDLVIEDTPRKGDDSQTVFEDPVEATPRGQASTAMAGVAIAEEIDEAIPVAMEGEDEVVETPVQATAGPARAAGSAGWTVLVAACAALVAFPLVLMVGLVSNGYTYGASPTNTISNPAAMTATGFTKMRNTGKLTSAWDADWFKSIQKIVVENPTVLTKSNGRATINPSENEWWGRPVKR